MMIAVAIIERYQRNGCASAERPTATGTTESGLAATAIAAAVAADDSSGGAAILGLSRGLRGGSGTLFEKFF
jgi:hypothetical protein